MSDARLAGSSPAPFGPTRPGERLFVLDVLRGFALLGIAVINLEGFTTPWAYQRAGREPFPAWYDEGARWLINFLGSGKFNATFSFLFGVGFALQMGRVEGRGMAFFPFYLRRLIALLAFGLVHLFLIWNGDVLHMYAVLGLGLLFVRRWSDRALLCLSAALLLVPMIVQGYEHSLHRPPEHPPSYWEARGHEQVYVYGHGNYLEMVALRVKEVKQGYLEAGDAWFLATLGVTLVLGFVAGRRRLFDDLPSRGPAIRKAFVVFGAIGLLCSAGYATASLFVDPQKEGIIDLVAGFLYEVTRPILSLAYICGLSLLAIRPAWRSRLEPLAAAGRMPLTNYLMQSVIASFLFYAYGLGLYGRVGPALGILVSFAIYFVQVLYSRWWLARFRLGPLEWVWRVVTYGRQTREIATPLTAGST